MQSEYLILQSPAKINLSLRVGNKLANGYHQVVTTITPIALFDGIKLKLSSEKKSRCRVVINTEIGRSLTEEKLEQLAATLSSLDGNIAARAAAAVLEDNPFELEIEKNIPIEAGLGGGSGDAATTLLLANQLRKNPFRKDELLQIASVLGYDVGPLMLRKTVRQQDGDIKNASLPADVAAMELLLIKPPISISTKEAYQKLNRPDVSESDEEFSPTFAIENDFEEIFFLEDWFQQGTQCLLELGAQRVLLCGSGSTIAGFFQAGSITSKSVLEARNRLNNWWVYQTRFWS